MAMLSWALLLFCAGWFVVGLASLFYVVFRGLTLILGMEVGILKEFKSQHGVIQDVVNQGPANDSKLKQFIKSRFTPTEGDFAPYSDEEAFVQEQVDHLRRQGLSDEELDAFIRQAVSADAGDTPTNG